MYEGVCTGMLVDKDNMGSFGGLSIYADHTGQVNLYVDCPGRCVKVVGLHGVRASNVSLFLPCLYYVLPNFLF